MQCKIRTNKKIIICSLLILGFTIANIGSNSVIEVHAAGNTPIYTLAGTESHSHKVDTSFMGSPTNYTDSYYKNTGIQIYASNNTGSGSSGTSIKLDSNSFYVDFTGSNGLYVPSTAYEGICYTIDYSFEIYNSSGYRQWYAKYSTNALEADDTPYTLTYNINGNVTTKYDTDGTLIANFNPSELGKRLVSLY